MLTRIEISGFKSYEDFGIDIGPHAIVLGANGVGKSNLFDALRLLAGEGVGAPSVGEARSLVTPSRSTNRRRPAHRALSAPRPCWASSVST